VDWIQTDQDRARGGLRKRYAETSNFVKKRLLAFQKQFCSIELFI